MARGSRHYNAEGSTHISPIWTGSLWVTAPVAPQCYGKCRRFVNSVSLPLDSSRVFSSSVWHGTSIKFICTPREFRLSVREASALSALKQSASLKRNPSWFQQVDFENFYPSSIILTALLLALRPDWEQPWGPTPPDNPPAIRNILNFCLDLISLQIWEPFGILGSFQTLIRSSNLGSHWREIMASLATIKPFQMASI